MTLRYCHAHTSATVQPESRNPVTQHNNKSPAICDIMASRQVFKVFVGNLNWTTGHRELRKYFTDFGRVVSAEVVFDKNSGLSKGFGFLQVPGSTIEKIDAQQGHVLEGRKIRVDKMTTTRD